MKTSKMCLTLFAVVVVLSLAGNAWASTIADWTFDTSKPTTAGPISPEVGAGTGTALHAGGNLYTAPAGNGSINSWSSNNWASGDYYQFVVDASQAGMNSGITIDYDQTGSATGPRDFILQYSTDGTNFTLFGSQYSLFSPAVTWSSGTSNTSNHRTATISALDGAATAYFRIQANSGTAINGNAIGTAGSSRIDDVIITGVPEPTTFVLGAIGLGLAGLVGARRYRRK